MQFLWKYIDDLVGKGLSFLDISQLMFYAAARLVPLALPISVLLSSIMTLGNIAEKNELIAIKSSGISLYKFTRPLFIFILFISASSFLFSNYIMPIANLKTGTLLYDIRRQKPSLNIKAGMFYNGIKGFSIKIDHKEENGIDLEGIMIYDHTSNMGNDKVIIAEKGQMYLSENEMYFIISLENGYSYYETEANVNNRNLNKNRPLQRTKFKKDIIRFDISDFGIQRSSENLYRNHYAMMTNKQLIYAIDSLKQKTLLNQQRYLKNISYKIQADTNTFLNKQITIDKKFRSKRIVKSAINDIRYTLAKIDNFILENNHKNTQVIKHEVEWHRKMALAIACISLFLIGAPLGAIIRRGGFGLPVVVSIGFFILYHVLSTTGEKMVKEGELDMFQGMWLANLVTFPIGLFLLYKATNDSSIFDANKLKRRITKAFKKTI